VAATVTNILMHPPPPLGLPAPAELERIIRKCLEKHRDLRYQTMRDLVIDLEALLEKMPEPTGTHAARRQARGRMWIAAGALGLAALAAVSWWALANRAPQTRRLAVLPFPTTDGWGDAFAAALAGRLARLDGLNVVSYSRSGDFAGRDPLAAAKELGVDTVLTGRAVRANGRTALELKLIDVPKGKDRWAGGRIEVADGETGGLERRVSEEVKRALGLKVTARDALLLARAGRAKGEAYNYFLRGWRQLAAPAEDAAQRALPLLGEALKLDPQYPDALGAAGLARAREFVAGRADRAALEAAQAGIKLALELDPDNVPALQARVEIEQSLGKAREAIEAARRLTAAAGNDVDALYAASSAYFRGGLLEAAAEAGERAQALDPVRADVRILASRTFYGLGEHRKGLEALQPILGRNLGGEAMALLHYTELKQYEDAAQAGAQHLARRQGEFNVWFDLGRAYALAGKDSQAQAAWREGARLAELQLAKVDNARNRLWLARIYAALGEKEKAQEQLARVSSDDPWTLFQASAASGAIGDRKGLLDKLNAAAERGFLAVQYLDANFRDGMPLAAFAGDPEVKAIRDRIAAEVAKLRAALR
jgi:tetratricopeptide (TPR) repeat protein